MASWADRLAWAGMAAVAAWGCADNDCANNKCVTEPVYETGMSRLVVLEPDDGALRWGADFQGERLDVAASEDGATLAVTAQDACFDAPRTLYFDMTTGRETTGAAPASPADLSGCPDLADTSWVGQVEGVCIGVRGDTAVGGDPGASEAAWEAAGAEAVWATGGVVMVGAAATGGYRVQRLQPATGAVVWQVQVAEPVQVIGADAQAVYLLGSAVEARDRRTGDVLWRSQLAFTLDPQRDGGAVTTDGVVVVRQEFPASPCS